MQGTQREGVVNSLEFVLYVIGPYLCNFARKKAAFGSQRRRCYSKVGVYDLLPRKGENDDPMMIMHQADRSRANCY